jgi:hypothetical protein
MHRLKGGDHLEHLEHLQGLYSYNYLIYIEFSQQAKMLKAR